MYIKDPTKKVQYTFRVKEDLMEDLKAYANAKNQKLPRILNDMISEYLDGMSLSNTWLREELGAIITIPKDITTKKVYPINLLDNDNDGLKYEIKAMPNNMAVWNDKYGYISKNPGVLYEGMEPLLIPGLIEDLKLAADEDTAQTIAKCLFGIHILHQDNDYLKVELVTMSIAIRLLETVNKDMAKIFVNYRTMLNREINTALSNLNEANHDKVKKELLEKMEELASKMNTGNVVIIPTKKFIATSIEFFNDKEELDNGINTSNNPHDVNDQLQKEIDQLKKENKELNDKLDNINAKIKRMFDQMEEIETNITWEDVINEY